MLSPKLTNSNPKKKLLVQIQKTGGGIFQDVNIFSSERVVDKDNNILMFFSKGHTTVSQLDFLNSHQTILALKKRHDTLPNPNKKHRNPPKRYDFSEEIKVCYTVQDNRKGRIAAKAYYCAILREGERMQHGKRLTEPIERGLRASSREALLARLEYAAFDERLAPEIVKDITSYYQGNMSSMTLKSLWFCCRERLNKSSNYQEDLARELFCDEVQLIGKLYPAEAGIQDFVDAMARFLKSSEVSAALKYWRLLALILDTAVSLGYLRNHPLAEHIRSLSSQATKEQREVRNALTKKTFTIEEESKIIQFICADTKESIGMRTAKRYEVESYCLAGALRLFTGIAVKELCALTWEDFVTVKEIGVSQLQITKFASPDGKVETHKEKENWKRFRRVPLTPVLTKMLLDRKQYLETNFSMTSEQLKKRHIILGKEPKGEASDWGVMATKPRALAEKCKKIIAAAEIPEQLLHLPDENNPIIMDMSKYQGDIFQSNFKYRANHTSALRRGEINYMLGLEPPDTFSRNYCDYTNDFIQYAIAQKLARWTAIHFNPESSNKNAGYSNNRLTQHGCDNFYPLADGALSVDIFLEFAQNCTGGTLEMEVDSEFGVTGSAMFFEKGEE